MANENAARRSGPISTAGKVGYSFLALFAALAGLVIFTGMFGRVGGSELNPYTFNTREFTYYEIPLLHVQVMPTARVPSSNTLQQWITGTERVLQTSEDKRWDLVEGARTGAKTVPGIAMTLAEYLNAQNGKGDLVWLEWSKKHNNLARKLWPRVAWLAQRELYYLIPDLMDFAKATDKTAGEFSNEADQWLQEKLEKVAEKIRAAGDATRAATLAREAREQGWRQLERDKMEAGDEGSDERGDGNGTSDPPRAEADA